MPLGCQLEDHDRQLMKWAASRNLLRKNSVHGEEEAKLVIAETFDSKNENGELMEWSGEAECEDRG